MTRTNAGQFTGRDADATVPVGPEPLEQKASSEVAATAGEGTRPDGFGAALEAFEDAARADHGNGIAAEERDAVLAEVSSLRAALDAATFRAREESRRADAALARAEKAEADRDGAKAWAVRAMQDCHGIEARHIEEQKARQAAEARLEEVRGALRGLLVFHGADDETLASTAAPDYRRAVLKARALAAPEPKPKETP